MLYTDKREEYVSGLNIGNKNYAVYGERVRVSVGDVTDMPTHITMYPTYMDHEKKTPIFYLNINAPVEECGYSTKYKSREVRLSLEAFDAVIQGMVDARNNISIAMCDNKKSSDSVAIHDADVLKDVEAVEALFSE